MGTSVSFAGLFTPSSRKSRSYRRPRRKLELTPQCEQLEIKIAPAVYTWTGGAGPASEVWSNTGNWQVNGTTPSTVPPGTGDQLVFPASVAQKTADNDLGTNTQFQSITIQDSGYYLFGNRLDLTGPLTYTATSGTASYQIATTYLGASAITVGANSQLSVSGQTLLATDTTIDVASGATVTLNTNIVQNGTDHTLTKSGSGTLILAATYSGTYGPTQIAAGTFQVDGTLDPAEPINLSAAATLTGTGSVGSVSSQGGIIAPGDNGPGLLTVNGLNLGGGTQFQVDLDGTTAGSGYDQVISNGHVNLTSVTLNPTVSGYTPSSTDRLMLIQNNSGVGLSGMFSNYPTQMGLVTVGTSPNVASFNIDYNGLNQSGNSLVLDGLNPTTTTLIPSAGPYTYGNTISFTTNVSYNGSPAADGATVELFDNSTMLGTQTITTGSAVFNVSTLNAGPHNDLYVEYLGDTNYAPVSQVRCPWPSLSAPSR